MFTILIGTCDKYQFLWDDFVHLFNKYWDGSIECDKYFLSETIAPQYDGFKSLLPGKVPYTDCLQYALDNIHSKYVLWLQDDYFFRKTISKSTFISYLDFITEYNVDRFGIHDDSQFYMKTHVKDNLYRLSQYSLYTISMQASIWNTDFFKLCIKESENPWQFEVNGSIRLNSNIQHYIYFDKQDSPWYVEGMRKGEFTQDYYRIKQEENL